MMWVLTPIEFAKASALRALSAAAGAAATTSAQTDTDRAILREGSIGGMQVLTRQDRPSGMTGLGARSVREAYPLPDGLWPVRGRGSRCRPGRWRCSGVFRAARRL